MDSYVKMDEESNGVVKLNQNVPILQIVQNVLFPKSAILYHFQSRQYYTISYSMKIENIIEVNT